MCVCVCVDLRKMQLIFFLDECFFSYERERKSDTLTSSSVWVKPHLGTGRGLFGVRGACRW